MSAGVAQTLSLISIVAALVSALLLYWGSLGVPHDMESWGGESEPERQYRRVRRWMVWVGIPCAVIAAACQAAIVLSPTI